MQHRVKDVEKHKKRVGNMEDKMRTSDTYLIGTIGRDGRENTGERMLFKKMRTENFPELIKEAIHRFKESQ